MTEIKIPFTKTKIIEKNTDPNNSANQVIDLEITTNYLMSQLEPRLDKLHGGSPDNTFAKMRFYFLNNAEPAVLQSLLDDGKTNFELTFTKEKVSYGVGGAGGLIDNTRPEVNLYQHPDSRMLEVKFSPQFAGIITLESKTERERERERERDENGSNGPDNHQPTPQEINNLKTELDQAKNDKEKLQKAVEKVEKLSKDVLDKNKDLESSLKKAKDQLKELEKKQTSSNEGFWRKEVIIPVALVLVVVVFIGIFFWVQKKGEEKKLKK